MSTQPYSPQRRRTRSALVAAARDLVAQGLTPTVELTAQAAEVSRTTAYRYFPSRASLLSAAHPEVATESLLPPDAPADVDARLDAVVARFVALIVDTEDQQRTMLRLSLHPVAERTSELPLRQGRAISWIGEALEPVRERLGDDATRALTLAIRSAVGIEALVWLTDVAGLTREDAARTMRWSAQAMLTTALAKGPPPAGASEL